MLLSCAHCLRPLSGPAAGARRAPARGAARRVGVGLGAAWLLPAIATVLKKRRGAVCIESACFQTACLKRGCVCFCLSLCLLEESEVSFINKFPSHCGSVKSSGYKQNTNIVVKFLRFPSCLCPYPTLQTEVINIINYPATTHPD